MKKVILFKSGNMIWLLIVLFFVGFGCSALDMKHKTTEENKTVIENKSEKSEKKDKDNESAPRFYDFKDVLVPGEFNIDDKHSSVIEAGNMTTGFLAFYGRVEGRSVIEFFSIKMPENGWKPISTLKSPFSTVMIFNKEKKWCTVNISEKGFNTDLQIGISPEITK